MLASVQVLPVYVVLSKVIAPGVVGNVSTKAVLSTAGTKLLFDKVIVKVVVPPAWMLLAPKALLIVGGLAAVVANGAVATTPVTVIPPTVAVGTLVVLVKLWFAAAMTTLVTVTVHVVAEAPLAAMKGTSAVSATAHKRYGLFFFAIHR